GPVGGNEKLEIYDCPGASAKGCDGVSKGGGEQPPEVQKVFDDNKRTVAIRQKQGTLPAIRIEGAGNVRNLVSGHKFNLVTQDGDLAAKRLKGEGCYVLTEVEHHSRLAGDYRSGDWGTFKYENRFACIPADLPFSPPRVTHKPTVAGSQTAVVVGPKGEEIFTDKYSRVKVQFHWDREGKNDADSSCWVRVATHW